MDAYTRYEMTNYYIAMNTPPNQKPVEQAVYFVDGYGDEHCLVVDLEQPEE